MTFQFAGIRRSNWPSNDQPRERFARKGGDGTGGTSLAGGVPVLRDAFDPFIEAWIELEPLIYDRVDALPLGAAQGTVEDFQHLAATVDAALVDVMAGQCPPRSSVPNACIFACLWPEPDRVAKALRGLAARYLEAVDAAMQTNQ